MTRDDELTARLDESELRTPDERLDAFAMKGDQGREAPHASGQVSPAYEGALGRYHDTWDSLFEFQLDGCGEDDGFWGVDVYPTPLELVFGPAAGVIVKACFSLELEGLCSEFARVDGMD